MDNHRQLALAWRLYAEDNQDWALDAGPQAGRYRLQQRTQPILIIMLWSGAHMDFNGGNRANLDVHYDMDKRPLWPYLKNQGVYKCPSDRSTVVFNGVTYPRILTITMNVYTGGFAPAKGAGRAGDDGGWGFAAGYWVYPRLTISKFPTRSSSFLMREDRVNWSNFMADMDGYFPPNPSLYSFTTDLPGITIIWPQGSQWLMVDSEIKRWRDPRTTPPLVDGGDPTAITYTPVPGSVDVAWLQDHSTRRK